MRSVATSSAAPPPPPSPAPSPPPQPPPGRRANRDGDGLVRRVAAAAVDDDELCDAPLDDGRRDRRARVLDGHAVLVARRLDRDLHRREVLVRVPAPRVGQRDADHAAVADHGDTLRSEAAARERRRDADGGRGDVAAAAVAQLQPAQRARRAHLREDGRRDAAAVGRAHRHHGRVGGGVDAEAVRRAGRRLRPRAARPSRPRRPRRRPPDRARGGSGPTAGWPPR